MGELSDGEISKFAVKIPPFCISPVKGHGMKYWAKSVATLISVLMVIAFTLLTLEHRSQNETFIRGGRSSIGSGNFKNSLLHRPIRQVEDECFSNLTVTPLGGNITSPGFPNQYESNQDCRWILNAPEDSNIVLNIETLDLELARNCELDYLQVYGGESSLSPSLGQFCGTLQNQVISTNSTKVLIIFHTDPSYEKQGFLIHYYIDSSEDCETTLTKESGTITSPKFPDSYPDNSECWTLISVVADKVILLQFDLLDLEFDENCTYDYIEIFDGALKDSPYIGRYCTGNQKPVIQSTTNFLLLHFFSDHLINKKGFRAHYTSITPAAKVDVSELGGCLWESESSNGTIASPNYPQKYPSNSKCNILLEAPPGENITIVFDYLQLELDANCFYDFLEVIDETTGVPIGKYCGKHSEPREIVSPKNKLRIIFNSDDFAEFSGFKARYWYSNSMKDDMEVPDATPEPSKMSTIEMVHASSETFVAVPQNTTIPFGASYILPCAFDDARARIRWLKDDQFLAGNNPLPGLKIVANNTLWIQSMNKQLVGVYMCAAITPERTESVKAWVNMRNYSATNTSCSIVLRKTPKDTYFTEGEFPSMECLAAGAQIQISWEKNGAPLELKNHIKVLSTGFLFFDKAVIEDSGLYTCVITDLSTNCQRRISALLTVNPKAKILEICGHPTVAQPSIEKPRLIHAKIVGGNKARKGAYPWQVMLWERHLMAFCGGTILNERWIVTAAHCFMTIKNLRWDDIIIKLGKHNQIQKEKEEFQTMIADPSSIIIHPLFNTQTFDNDIALVRLRDHIRFNDYMLPACLPDRELAEHVFDASELRMGTVIGWGKLVQGGGSSEYLQEIRMPIINQQTCFDSTNFPVTQNMFCAGYGQEIIGDACQGDSGGPFLIKHEAKWYLIGIVSWGEGCGKLEKYGFYTKITNYQSWIKGIIKS